MKVIKNINGKKFPMLSKLVSESKADVAQNENKRYTIVKIEGKKIENLTKLCFSELETLEKHCKMNFTYFWAFCQ